MSPVGYETLDPELLPLNPKPGIWIALSYLGCVLRLPKPSPLNPKPGIMIALSYLGCVLRLKLLF